jgi:hypothetical protein
VLADGQALTATFQLVLKSVHIMEIVLTLILAHVWGDGQALTVPLQHAVKYAKMVEIVPTSILAHA